MTIRDALRQGTDLLEGASVLAPRLTAEVLLSYAMKRERVYFIAHPDQVLSTLEWLHYGRYLWQRMEGRPTQYITKRQEFYGREFAVSPAVLIPRPETEHLVEAVLSVIGDAADVVDVGTGSGAIAVTLSLEAQRPVVAVDISADALTVARGNARRLGAAVRFVQGDLLSSFAHASLDLVVSNPPYISEADEPGLMREVREHEPRLALIGGPRGTEVYDRLIGQAEQVLRPGGWLLLELGYDSAPFVSERLQRWTEVTLIPDYAGIVRVCRARLGYPIQEAAPSSESSAGSK